MARKRTPQAALAAVDAYEAGQKRDDSNSACARESQPSPMRKAVKLANKAAWAEATEKLREEMYDHKANEIKYDLAQMLEDEAAAALRHAMTVRHEADYAQAVGAAVKAIPVARLIREKATSITETRPSTVEERDGKLAEIVEKVKLRMVG